MTFATRATDVHYNDDTGKFVYTEQKDSLDFELYDSAPKRKEGHDVILERNIADSPSDNIPAKGNKLSDEEIEEFNIVDEPDKQGGAEAAAAEVAGVIMKDKILDDLYLYADVPPQNMESVSIPGGVFLRDDMFSPGFLVLKSGDKYVINITVDSNGLLYVVDKIPASPGYKESYVARPINSLPAPFSIKDGVIIMKKDTDTVAMTEENFGQSVEQDAGEEPEIIFSDIPMQNFLEYSEKVSVTSGTEDITITKVYEESGAMVVTAMIPDMDGLVRLVFGPPDKVYLLVATLTDVVEIQNIVGKLDGDNLVLNVRQERIDLEEQQRFKAEEVAETAAEEVFEVTDATGKKVNISIGSVVYDVAEDGVKLIILSEDDLAAIKKDPTVISIYYTNFQDAQLIANC
jgi:hypothetical protein